MIIEIGDLLKLVMLLQLALDSLMLWHPTYLIGSEGTIWHLLTPRISLSKAPVLTAIESLPRLDRVAVKHRSLLVIIELGTEQRLLLLDTIRGEHLGGRNALRLRRPPVLLVG